MGGRETGGTRASWVSNAGEPIAIPGYDRALMIRAVLFDFNGVLIADEAIHVDLLDRVLGEEGVTPPADSRVRFLGRPDRDCLREGFALVGRTIEDGDLHRLLARKASYYGDHVRRAGHPLVDSGIALLRSVAAAGLPVGIVSGALRSEIDQALRQAGVRALVKVVVAAEDVRVGKPSPEGYLRGLDLLNATPPLPARLLHPHEVLAIEDAPVGLRAARDAGLATLGVATSVAPAELGAADVVLEDLVGVEAAELIALFATR